MNPPPDHDEKPVTANGQSEVIKNLDIQDPFSEAEMAAWEAKAREIVKKMFPRSTAKPITVSEHEPWRAAD